MSPKTYHTFFGYILHKMKKKDVLRLSMIKIDWLIWKKLGRLQKGIVMELFFIILLLIVMFVKTRQKETEDTITEQKDYIEWVDFNVTCEALEKAYQYDVELHGTEKPVDWIMILAYVAAKTGGNFENSKTVYTEMDSIVTQWKEGKVSIESLQKDLKYFDYYYEAYTAVLGGLVGEYKIQQKESDDTKDWVENYGLKGFSPIAKGFEYSDYDDFGVSRSYGYERKHLGHDMMGQTGTPIIAVESGVVEALGWNQYGGWRIGIRSFDKKRYYYYAHLRQNFPYCKSLEVGSVVTAGDVIGYLGHTGYSVEENVNNISIPHLHFGIQLIFDESQKEGVNEIWIDPYSIIKFLLKNRSETEKNIETKEWSRIYQMIDPAVEYYEKTLNK